MTRVVALGGGHGLAASLRAVRRYASDITAIVSVADDGGSSGRLRDALGIPAPGDLRKCLVALGDPYSTWTRVFDLRFEGGELQGHALGNLIIAGLTRATGDFVEALDEAANLVDAVGTVLPATTVPVVLRAETASGEIHGQVNVQEAGRLSAVSLVPPDPPAPKGALDAIARADQIVIGPGSLFTSVLATLVVPEIRDALKTTRAQKVYVVNLRPQIPETEGYDDDAHVEALIAHGVDPDVVLKHTRERPLYNDMNEGHDPARLAEALAELVDTADRG